MGTKETMVTAPVILLLYDRTFVAGSFRGAKRLPEAIARFQKSLQTAPDSADLHNSLALAPARSGNLTAALAECETAFRLRPDFPAAQTNLSLFRRRAGLAE